MGILRRRMNTADITLPGCGARQPFFEMHAEALGLTPLAGAGAERWFAPGPVSPLRCGRFHGARAQDYIYLAATVAVPPGDSLETPTHDLYAELLSTLTELGCTQPLRFWNYLPTINAGSGDAERYRQFVAGRAQAYDAQPLPYCAATATGSKDGTMFVGVLAAPPTVAATHLENPRQVSAYDYPRAYGPRAPGFARATLVGDGSLLLISGTASIVEHRSLHEGDIAAQLEEIRRNVDSLKGQTSCHTPVAVRCYVRNPCDLETVRHAWHRVFPDHPQPMMLASDICRRELLVEIEAVYLATGA